MITAELLLVPPVEVRAAILFMALALDWVIGDPDRLWRRVPHPIVGMGKLIGWCDETFNQMNQSPARRRLNGTLTIIALILMGAVVAGSLSLVLSSTVLGFTVQTVLVTVLLAAGSLHTHVQAVALALRDEGLAAGRRAVSMIVGRDPEQLDTSGVSRGAIESVAENFSDGVVAPAFWFLVAGLPGIVLYKLINTADSMIGHKTDRHGAFGWAAARIDDIANYIPARISGFLIVAGNAFTGRSIAKSVTVMLRDASKHASPNAGWPETAMAGGLGIALAGPRTYPEYTSTDPWLNETGSKQTDHTDIFSALAVIRGAWWAQWLIVAMIIGIAGLM